MYAAKIGRVYKRYVYLRRARSEELLEANEPKSHYCANGCSSYTGFVFERSRGSILSHPQFLQSENVENGWRNCISETKSA